MQPKPAAACGTTAGVSLSREGLAEHFRDAATRAVLVDCFGLGADDATAAVAVLRPRPA